MKVKNEIHIYELNGSDTNFPSRPVLVIESHWNNKDRVNLTFPDGTKITVMVAELDAAIRNATNWK